MFNILRNKLNILTKMVQKKNPKLELSRYSNLFFSIGLSISIGLVILVFEIEVPEKASPVNLASSSQIFEEIIEDVPLTQQQFTPPKIQQPKVIEVPDEEEISSDIDFDLDIEMTEETVIEELAIEHAPEEEISDEVFSVVEEMPSFPGGTAGFYDYVTQNLKYPRKAKKAGVEGKVIIRFTVGLDGDISEVEIVKGLGFDIDEEALRIMQASPKWTPGKQGGRIVKVSMLVPLNFDLS